MNTNLRFIKSVVVPRNLILEIKKINNSIIAWVYGINGSWYFILSNNFDIEYCKNSLNFYSCAPFSAYEASDYSFKFQKLTALLTSLQKVITGVGPGYRGFMHLRGRKCLLEPKKCLVKAKITLPYVIKQGVYSHFKMANQLCIKNKGKGRLREQRVPVLRIRSKSLNMIQQWCLTFRRRELPNFYTGQGIRYPKDIVADRYIHALRYKERRNKKSMRGKRRKKKAYAYILTAK